MEKVRSVKQDQGDRGDLASLGGESRRVSGETWWPRSNTLDRVLQQHGVGVALCLTEPRDKSSCREFAYSNPYTFSHFILQLV